MNAKNMRLYIFLSFVLIYQINSFANTFQDIIHIDSELAKVCKLNDKSVLVLSSVRGVQQTKESKLDEKGNVIYGNSTLNLGYTASAELVQPKAVNGTQPNYLFTYHNKQNLQGQLPNEFVTEFNQGVISRTIKSKNYIYQKKSTVALESGIVFMAGIINDSTFGANTTVEINIFDPIKNIYGTGYSLSDAKSKYISCFELTANNVYCLYVSHEDFFISKLRIKHIIINDKAMTLSFPENENKEVIKNFYTVFNFIKAVKFNDQEAVVLFQTGNDKNPPKYGNSGKDLYYYHLQILDDSIHVKRYEYLYDSCLYREDPEHYNADIAVLSENRIFATCETAERRLKGFIIYPGIAEYDEFFFNNFEAADIKNPVFAKFDKSLGIFYTHINQNENSKVAFHLINYPDCFNFRDEPILLPKNRAKEFDFSGKVFLNNAYPADKQSDEISVRFETLSNLTLLNLKDNKTIVENIDYDPVFTAKVTTSGLSGIYSVEYTATRNDPLDGLIVGRTCKINFNTPKCLPQCDSCTKTGDDISHKCLDCADGPYYEDEDPKSEFTDYGKTINCPRCNISCSSCYGAFRFKPLQTTNCKKCDYSNGYYHFELDETVCISLQTQENWTNYFNRSIYLDDTAGEDNKDKWRWKFCHPNCKKCHGPGTDEDNQCDECIPNLYFFCNQTKGNGIPGSCHEDCVDNGFFLKESEGMLKCCNCLDGCQICPNETICKKCFYPHFLTPEKDKCVDDCGYCLAKDWKLMECVNCKNRYDSPKYNLNGTCYDEIPEITYPDPDVFGKKHHVIDETCNLLIGCKEGCKNCSEWYTEKCTLCFPDFYKEDFFSLIEPPTFYCFKEKECQGIEPYQFNKSLRIGGVPKILDGEGVCYNCRLRENPGNNYRQVENNFTCGPKPKKTFVDILHYNKLSQCYTRCASCDDWGNSCFHNCTSCRDPAIYELKLYNPNGKYGNCVRYTHKCKDLPFYHDYDLAAKLGIDEDKCGQDCDVCLENRTCTENFPYFVIATRECVELCPLNEVLSQTCLMNHPNAGYILLKNPFELRNTFTPINQTVNINQIISSTIFQEYAKMYNIDIDSTKKEINNYLGNGQVFNLPESKIIIGNNISIELTSVRLELEKLASKLSGLFSSTESTSTKDTQITEKEKEKETSILDISECEKILKKTYGLPENEDLIIIKGDTLKQYQEYLGVQTDYQLFSTSLGAFMPLSICKEGAAEVTIVNPFNETKLISLFQYKTSAVTNNNYDPFDINSPFYNDICTPFTNEYGRDVLLDDRIKDYFNSKLKLCDSGCSFVSYNATTHYYTCKCPIKDTINGDTTKNGENENSNKLPENLYKKHKNSNIEVFKCASQVFSSKGQNKNFGSYVLLLCFAGFIASIVIYFVKGTSKINETFNQLAGNPIPASPPKPTDPKSSEEKVEKINNKIEDFIINEEQLNGADFEIAKKYDKRGYLKIYWSLLKMKQLCIFTFYTSTDYNLRIVKIALFILFLSFYFAFTALFFNDKIMRQIYIYKGNTDAAVHVPNIILSSLCCIIMNFIVRFVSLSERDISKINSERNADNKKKLCEKTQKLLKIKLLILFIISAILIGICWYYVSAFCAVFKNSQGHYFINVLVAFIVCNVWPCVTSLIPPILRKKSIDNDSSCMYTASQIISYI